MPDIDDALVTDVRALNSRVVCVYGVVVILGRWVRVGYARLWCAHEAPPRGPEPGSAATLAGLND
jgi:hypothetical protein